MNARGTQPNRSATLTLRRVDIPAFGIDTWVPLPIECVALSFRLTNPGNLMTLFVEGMATEDIWFGDSGAALDLPPVHSPDGLFIPYRQLLRMLATPTVVPSGSFTFTDAPAEMISQTHSLRFRIIPLNTFAGVGQTLNVEVDSVAAFIRVFTYDPATTVNGMPLLNLASSGPAGSCIAVDLPVMYDPAGHAIPYRETLTFANVNAQFIQGAVTLVDIVPNR